MVFLGLLISLSVSFSYECGAHGKFEYCIDGIPGCVIGCHCHPGYYFDTDTKICESNIRLTQNYRRNYDVSGPERIFLRPTPPAVEEPVTTVKSAVDEKIDIITKDADDLGDWLYNQFFKTIENQVINETKDEALITRRSDSGPTFLKKPTRRSHKYWRAKKKKKKKKKRKGLQSKLLRITEDDSLFDSSSTTSSDESSDSGSSSSDASDGHSIEKRIKSDHGHKKIVVFSKRPKPPLPSFIFLPNMETPFYPPIGLPPPPIPMYPMVPVPPVIGPYPFSGPQIPYPNDGGSTTNSGAGPLVASETTIATTTRHQIPTSETTTVLSTTNEKWTREEPPEENAETKDTNDQENNGTRPRSRKRKKSRRGSRDKLMRKLQDFKRLNKQQNIDNEYQELDSPIDVDDPIDNVNNPAPDHLRTFPGITMQKPMSALQNIDFKYLSQLIHRADLNNTNHHPISQPPSLSSPSNIHVNVMTPPPPSRRNYYDSGPSEIAQLLTDLAKQPIKQNPIPYQTIYDKPAQASHNVPYRKIEDPNDIYYATLGRQIASMIRNIEGDRDVDIEISGSNYASNPVFNRNSGSGSYWERSVRSPYKYMNSLKYKINSNLKRSNENLFSLENQVSFVVSSAPPLSLHQLENIISKVERAKSKLNKKKDTYDHATESSNTSFNVNLLPRSYQYIPSKRTVKKTTQNISTKKITKQPHKQNEENTRRQNTKPLLNRLPPEPKNMLLKDFMYKLRNPFEYENGTGFRQKIIPIVLPTRNPKNIGIPHYKQQKNYFSSYAYTVLPLPRKQPVPTNIKLPSLQATTGNPGYYQLNPKGSKSNQKDFNHYFIRNNNHQHLFEKAVSLPLLPNFSNHIKAVDNLRPNNPSYFHHMMDFDNFNEFL